MSKYKPVTTDRRKGDNRVCGDAWDFDGRTFRFSLRKKAYTMDLDGKSVPVDDLPRLDRDRFERFMAQPLAARLPHRRCAVCGQFPAANKSTRCSKCARQHILNSGECVVDGCSNPRHKSAKGLSSMCHRCLREQARQVYAQELHSNPAPEVVEARVKREPVLPYAYRNLRPGSMSEALRIDTGVRHESH